MEELVEQLVAQSLDLLPVSVLVQSPDGRVRRSNARARSGLHQSGDELHGQEANDDLWVMVDEEGRSIPPEQFTGVIVGRTGEPILGRVVGVGLWEWDPNMRTLTIDEQFVAVLGGHDPATIDEWVDLVHAEDRDRMRSELFDPGSLGDRRRDGRHSHHRFLSPEGVENDNTARVITAMVEVGHAIGAMNCAQGIETDDQIDAMISIGIDLLSGYRLGRPVPLDTSERARRRVDRRTLRAGRRSP